MHLHAPLPTTSMKFSQVTCTLLLFISIYLFLKKIWPHPMACGTLVPQLGIKPTPPMLDLLY